MPVPHLSVPRDAVPSRRGRSLAALLALCGLAAALSPACKHRDPNTPGDEALSPSERSFRKTVEAAGRADEGAAEHARLAKAIATQLVDSIARGTRLQQLQDSQDSASRSATDASDALVRARYLIKLERDGVVPRGRAKAELRELAARAEHDATDVERRRQTLDNELAKFKQEEPGAEAPSANAARGWSGKSMVRTESPARRVQKLAQLPDSGPHDAEQGKATVTERAPVRLEQDCDPATLEKGLPVYSNPDDPAQDFGPPVAATDVGDLNGDGQVDVVVEYQAARTGRAIKLYVREPAPGCFREVYSGQGGGVGLAPERHAGWADITFGVQKLFTECGFGWMNVRASYDDGRYRIQGGANCRCRYDDRVISRADCNAAADGEVCQSGGAGARAACVRACVTGDVEACRSACGKGDVKSCERGCNLRDRKACDSLCPLDSVACRSICSAGNNVACAADCDQNIESPSCLALCKKKDAKACANSCITSHEPCNALCKAGNEAACSAADPEVTEQVEAAAAQREQAVAEAKLPGLFDKCERNRALIFGVKKRWIAARRAGDQASAEESEKQMNALEPQWGRALSEIREAIRVVSGDQGPKFVRYVREVERRCSLPQSAGF